MSEPEKSDRVFFGQLEALCGIAAMTVLTFHVFETVPATPTALKDLGPISGSFTYLLTGIFNGSGAVTLFFILSGFVLGCNIDAARTITVPGYSEFIIRRLSRIVPAMWLSVILAVALNTILRGQHYSLHQGFNFLLMQDTSINGPLWSIQVELLASIVYPFLLFASRSLGVLFNLVLLSILIWFSLGETPFPMRYLWCFELGILLPVLGKPLIETLPKRLHVPLLILAFIAFGTVTQFARLGYVNPKHSIQVEGWMAFYFIAFVMYGHNAAKDAFLTAGRWIGRISYSLYVIHFPIHTIVMAKLAGYFGAAFTMDYPAVQLLALPVVAGCSLVLAHLSYQFIEMPLHRLGRPAARWIAGQLSGIRAQIVPQAGGVAVKRIDMASVAGTALLLALALVFCYSVFTAALRM